MAIFKSFANEDIKPTRSFLNQLVDVVDQDISGSSTRRKYQVFVTGGLGPGVTSSLWQTVFDQDFTLQTANPIFDMTIGLATGSAPVVGSGFSIDSNGKYIFPQSTLMMREKIDLYRLFAQRLLGSEESLFTLNDGVSTIPVQEALFIAYKRLFSRDGIKRETFAMRVLPTASLVPTPTSPPNLFTPYVGTAPTKIYSDIGSSQNKSYEFGGQVSQILDSSNTSYPVGLLFLDQGIAVLDIARSFDGVQVLSGTIDAITVDGDAQLNGSMNRLLMSASIDDIVDHFGFTRFASGSVAQSAMTFQNITEINTTNYFIRLGADEFNYSSNPTYTDENNRIVVIDEGQEETQQSFTFLTSIGLYDANDNLLAVAKTSRPILKDNERDITLKVRLDY